MWNPVGKASGYPSHEKKTPRVASTQDFKASSYLSSFDMRFLEWTMTKAVLWSLSCYANITTSFTLIQPLTQIGKFYDA